MTQKYIYCLEYQQPIDSNEDCLHCDFVCLKPGTFTKETENFSFKCGEDAGTNDPEDWEDGVGEE